MCQTSKTIKLERCSSTRNWKLEAFKKAEHNRHEGHGCLSSMFQANETQECDTQTMTLIKNVQKILSEYKRK